MIGDLRDPYYETAYAPVYDVIDQYFGEMNYGFFLSTEAHAVRCQEFRPVMPVLFGVETYLTVVGDPGNLIFTIKDETDQILYSDTASTGIIPGTYWANEYFNPVLLLVPGQKYKICLTTDQAYVDPSNVMTWRGHSASTYHCSDCGTGITSLPDFDFNFRTLSRPVEPV